MQTYIVVAAAALAVAVALPSAASAGTANRAWVSGKGMDQAGCGAPTAPCRSLQYALDNIVAASGEIDILDPAGYGAANITKPVSIVNDGVGTAGVQSTSGAAITINIGAAGSSPGVILRGLNIDGVQGAGSTGIKVTSLGLAAVGVLTVTNCVVRHFSGDAIVISSVGDNVTVADSVLSDNGGAGLDLAPDGTAGNVGVQLDRLTIQNNATGVAVNAVSATSSNAFVSLEGSTITGNTTGLSVVTPPAVRNIIADVKDTTVSRNGGQGVSVQNAALVYLTRTLISENGADGVANGSAAPGGVLSTGDNDIAGNSPDLSGAALVANGPN